MSADPTGRRARLRWLAVLVIAAVSALALFAGVLTWQLTQTWLGNRAWRAGDLVAADTHHTRALRASVVQRWIAPYNRGVARFGLNRWDASADDFELAAALAPESEQCRVRLNWSWALEAGGDELIAADDVQGAMVRWRQAQQVLADADCPDERASDAEESEPQDPADPQDEDGDEQGEPEGTLREQWDETRQRIEEKTTGRPMPEEAEEPPEPQDADAQLTERGEQSQQERQESQDAQDAGPSADGPTGATW